MFVYECKYSCERFASLFYLNRFLTKDLVRDLERGQMTDQENRLNLHKLEVSDAMANLPVFVGIRFRVGVGHSSVELYSFHCELYMSPCCVLHVPVDARYLAVHKIDL